MAALIARRSAAASIVAAKFARSRKLATASAPVPDAGHAQAGPWLPVPAGRYQQGGHGGDRAQVLARSRTPWLPCVDGFRLIPPGQRSVSWLRRRGILRAHPSPAEPPAAQPPRDAATHPAAQSRRRG